MIQEFPLGVVAHSDGDVVYHSTIDAILGSLALLHVQRASMWDELGNRLPCRASWQTPCRANHSRTADSLLLLAKPRVFHAKQTV